MVPYCYLFLLFIFILWFSYYVSDIFYWSLGSWMTTCLGKSCSFGLLRMPFINCCQFMYLVISLLVLRAGYGIWLYQFLIIAYLFTFQIQRNTQQTKATAFHPLKGHDFSEEVRFSLYRRKVRTLNWSSNDFLPYFSGFITYRNEVFGQMCLGKQSRPRSDCS